MASSVSDKSCYPGGQAGETQPLDQEDVTRLLHLMADLASVRNDPRRWRLEALGALQEMLRASAAAAFVVKLRSEAPESPAVVSIFDSGFKVAAEHAAFLSEFNQAPFHDPLSKRVIAAARRGEHRTITATRRDLVSDEEWYGSPNVQHYRRTAKVDDCVISVQRAGTGEGGGGVKGVVPEREGEEMQLMVLMAFRPLDHPDRFCNRTRMIVDTLHRGLEWVYRSEAASLKMTRATSLSPRLRQTLDFLLAGDTERQVAARMEISIHTVHDYVKALYVHFGVSSRGELMARWIQSGEPLPAGRRGPS